MKVWGGRCGEEGVGRKAWGGGCGKEDVERKVWEGVVRIVWGGLCACLYLHKALESMTK